MLFMLEQAWSMLSSLTKYYLAFGFFYCGGSLDKCTLFGGRRLPAVHMFTLAQTMLLWDAPHYRAISFSNDLSQNVRNIAIPGTGLPLSVFCSSQRMMLLFILLINPIISLLAALHTLLCRVSIKRSSNSGNSSREDSLSYPSSLAAAFHELLLEPQHWFAIWRHNCLLMGWHQRLTNSSSYRLEDKGTFLLDGAQLGLPVSPFFEDTPALFVKHKSIEGGMGVHVFKNFAHGGDWIFQKALTNSSFLSSMLPPSAPLSTLRIVTASIFWLEEWQRQQQQHARPLQLTTDFLHKHEQRMASHESQLKDNLVAVPAGIARHSGGSSSGGNEQRASSRPLALSISADGVWRPGPLTPPLPMSAGVVTRRIHTEGRDGQFVDAVKSLTAQGLTDPALGTGLTKDGIDSISTRRTMSADSHQQSASADGPAALAAETNQAAAAADISSSSPQRQQQHQHASDAAALEEDNLAYAGQVEVVTAVWRAGLAGACTDHSCVCFAIDPDTGELQEGVTGNHWYQLGLEGVGRVATGAQQVHTAHPDSRQQVTGRTIPNMAEVVDVVVQAHVVAAPDLPLIGWDVALTSEGVSILEVNLSCNLFNGSFDKEGYYEFMYQYLRSLQQVQRQRAGQHSRKANHM